jgi:glutathione synthase/RimK-type ligase-like ATP-grasp enzyme
MKYLIIDKRPRVQVDSMGKYPTAVVRLMEELDKKNIAYDFVYNDQIEFFYHSGETVVIFNGTDIKEYSHIIYRGHNLHSPKEYEMKRLIIDWTDQYNLTHPDSTILVQNSEALKKMPYYNKIYTAQICSTHNIPYFDTYYSTDGNYTKQRDVLNEYPLIIKEYAGVNRVDKKWGKEVIKKNVYKLNNENDLKQKYLRKQDLKNFFIQEFSPIARDIRLFVKLGEVIGGFKREANSGFMTVSKGKYKIYNTPTPQERELAQKVAKVFDADFIAIDLMYKEDKPYLQEIGFHPGFKAYETKITDGKPINVAEAIITAFRG